MSHEVPIGEAEFVDLMSSCQLSGENNAIAVAVSGGADSMALGVLAHKWGQAVGVTVTTLTVDHGLRTGSASEASQVKTWLLAHGIAHETLIWHPPQNISTAIQSRARDARYALMTAWCVQNHVSSLLVAHHQGDQAETVLMRLKKKSTLYGLCAMASVRLHEGIRVCRPVLSVPKSRLKATLKAVGQDWIEDPSNQNKDFERVRVRANLKYLEKEGVRVEALANVANSIRRVCNVIDKSANQLIETEVSAQGQAGLRLSPDFLKAPHRVTERALSKLLIRVGKGGYPPSPQKLKRLMTWMEQPTIKSRTLGGTLIRLQGSGFEISPERPRNKRVYSVK